MDDPISYFIIGVIAIGLVELFIIMGYLIRIEKHLHVLNDPNAAE